MRAGLLEMLRTMPAVRQVCPLVDVRTKRLHVPFRFTRGVKLLGLVPLGLARAPLPDIAGRLRLVAELASDSRGRSVRLHIRRTRTEGRKLALQPGNHVMALHEEHTPQRHRGNREPDFALRSRTARLRVPNRDDVTAICSRGDP